MKKNKSNLDEMQELKALKIEHTGYYLFYCMLVISIIVQTILTNADFKSIAGECIVLTSVCVYMSIAYLKNGIWDRKLKPNVKTNTIISIAVSCVSGIIYFIISYRNYHNFFDSIATFTFMFIFTFILCFGVFSLSLYFYNKKMSKLDNDNE